MVQNSEWGPPLWQILHLVAERCGTQPTQMLHMDEVRAFIALLEIVEAILPCPLCQKHYREWRKEHPLRRFLEERNGSAFQLAARTWLWRLHDRVNAQRNVERMGLDEAVEKYSKMGSSDLQQALERLLEVLERAKLQRLIDGTYVREWRKRLVMLRTFLRV